MVLRDRLSRGSLSQQFANPLTGRALLPGVGPLPGPLAFLDGWTVPTFLAGAAQTLPGLVLYFLLWWRSH